MIRWPQQPIMESAMSQLIPRRHVIAGMAAQ